MRGELEKFPKPLFGGFVGDQQREPNFAQCVYKIEREE
jgi:hypothetical protein